MIPLNRHSILVILLAVATMALLSFSANSDTGGQASVLNQTYSSSTCMGISHFIIQSSQSAEARTNVLNSTASNSANNTGLNSCSSMNMHLIAGASYTLPEPAFSSLFNNTMILPSSQLFIEPIYTPPRNV